MSRRAERCSAYWCTTSRTMGCVRTKSTICATFERSVSTMWRDSTAPVRSMFCSLSKEQRCTGRLLRKNSTMRWNSGESQMGGQMLVRRIHSRMAIFSCCTLAAKSISAPGVWPSNIGATAQSSCEVSGCACCRTCSSSCCKGQPAPALHGGRMSGTPGWAYVPRWSSSTRVQPGSGQLWGGKWMWRDRCSFWSATLQADPSLHT
mmetsp:Transcript_35923/g.64241  ORF Transcript_35923/g.64241 Transcript_35923/m.64241 type:complete len:205 (+) Transcript_35923:3814-4428(+)